LKIVFVVTAVCTFALFSYAGAQTIEAFGLKFGAVHAEQKWEYSSQVPVHGVDGDPLWGINVSSFMRLSMTTTFSVVAELHYVQRGRSITFVATVQSDNPRGYTNIGLVETKLRFHYLSVPVLAQIRLGGDRVVPYIDLGPRVEYLLSTPDSPVYDQFAKWEFGGTCAVGVEVSIGSPLRLLAEVSYDTNFTHSFASEYVSVSNRSFSILLGVCL
jgi:hypothetical protein